jgi:hypothetical protein
MEILDMKYLHTFSRALADTPRGFFAPMIAVWHSIQQIINAVPETQKPTRGKVVLIKRSR